MPSSAIPIWVQSYKPARMDSYVVPQLCERTEQENQPEGNQDRTVALLPPHAQGPTDRQVALRLVVGFQGQGSSVLHVIQAGRLAAAFLFISEAKDKWGRNMSLNHKTFRQRHGKFLLKKGCSA